MISTFGSPPPLRTSHGRLDDRPDLHRVQARLDDPQPHAAQAEHRVHLVQLARPSPAASPASRARPRRAASRRAPPRTARSTWSGRNSCSGGSSSRTVTGSPSIASKMPTKSSRCSGSSDVVRRLLLLVGLGEDHLPHRGDPLLAQEHVLGPAQADALGAALARVRGLVGRVGVRADPQPPARVGALHEPLERLPDRLLARLRVALHAPSRAGDSSSCSSPTYTLPVNPSIVIAVALAHGRAVRA